MRYISISMESSGKELETIARAIHQIIKLPVVIASLNRPGLIIEEGRVLDYEYIDPILKKVLEENRVIRIVPDRGRYRGFSYIVSPLRNDEGQAIAAIGIVDTYGITDLTELFGNYPGVTRQVDTFFKKGYKG